MTAMPSLAPQVPEAADGRTGGAQRRLAFNDGEPATGEARRDRAGTEGVPARSGTARAADVRHRARSEPAFRCRKDPGLRKAGSE